MLRHIASVLYVDIRFYIHTMINITLRLLPIPTPVFCDFILLLHEQNVDTQNVYTFSLSHPNPTVVVSILHMNEQRNVGYHSRKRRENQGTGCWDGEWKTINRMFLLCYTWFVHNIDSFFLKKTQTPLLSLYLQCSSESYWFKILVPFYGNTIDFYWRIIETTFWILFVLLLFWNLQRYAVCLFPFVLVLGL